MLTELFMNNNFSVITATVVRNILNQNPNDVYKVVKEAYVKHGQNKAQNPPSYFLRFPDKPKSRIIALPSLIMENPRIAGIKWISSNPDNLAAGFKRASAVIILNDYETGYPIACLEGSIISALRTIYSAILVSNLLPITEKKRIIGIIGAGNIAEEFIQGIYLQNWGIKVIKVFDYNINASKSLKERIKQKGIKLKVEIIKELRELVVSSNLIFLSTTASDPYIKDLTWLSHNPVILNISLRDIDPQIIIYSNNIVDDKDHVINANTSPHLAQQKYGHTNFINCSIAELISGYNRFDLNKPIILSPMGMGILDLALAHYIFNEAMNSSMGITINSFF